MIEGVNTDPDKIGSLAAITAISPIYKGPLTKKTLMAIPSGLYIASNSASAYSHPSFCARIPTRQERLPLWATLRESEAYLDLFYVFNNRPAYDAYVSVFRNCANVG